MKANANIYVDIDGVLCVEIAAGFGDAIKLHTWSEAVEFTTAVIRAAEDHFHIKTGTFYEEYTTAPDKDSGAF